jgi:hypothetical protein
MKTKIVISIFAACLLSLAAFYLCHQSRTGPLQADNKGGDLTGRPPTTSSARAENTDGSNQNSRNDPSIRHNTDRDKGEILRLRGDISVQKQEVDELRRKLQTSDARKELEQRLGKSDLQIASESGSQFSPNHYYKRELWADVGSTTPEAALQSFLAVIKNGDLNRAVDLLHLTQEERAAMAERLTSDRAAQFPTSSAEGIKMESLAESSTSSEVEFVTEIDRGTNIPSLRAHFYLERDPSSGWKVSPNVTFEGESEKPF